MKVLEGLHADIRDFELVCEGEIRDAETAPAGLKLEGSPLRQASFQGSYAYRAVDGAAYLDLFKKHFDPGQADLRTTYAQLKGTSSEVARALDSRGSGVPIIKQIRGVGSLTSLPPERFLFLRRWRGLGYSFDGQGYKCEGWEEIDGNPVLRFSIDNAPKSPNARHVVFHYWIDLKRGGHVLRVEMRMGPDLWWRLDGVQLARVKLGAAKEIWFPVRAEFDSFLFNRKVLQSPVFHESYRVVQGTLVFNRGLPDERFSIEWKGHQAETPASRRRSKSTSQHRSWPHRDCGRTLRVSKRIRRKGLRRRTVRPPNWMRHLLQGKAGIGPCALQGLLALSGAGVLRLCSTP